MKLFIWEGKGISDGYHDDGTLVVLAEDPAQARELARTQRAEHDAREKEWERADRAWRKRVARWTARAHIAYEAQVKKWADEKDPRQAGTRFAGYNGWRDMPEGKAWAVGRNAYPPTPPWNHRIDSNGVEIWDGYDEDKDKPLDRDPDRVVDLDKPAVVAFNGGGYD